MAKYETQDTIEIGKGNVLLKGEKIAIFAYGSRVDSALKAGKDCLVP
jgi:transketolase C-terminal domain/subunit